MSTPTLEEQRITRRQAAILGAFTGVLCGPFEDMHKLVEELFERPVWTHEMGSEKFAAELKEKSRPLFFAILPEEPRK